MTSEYFPPARRPEPPAPERIYPKAGETFPELEALEPMMASGVLMAADEPPKIVTFQDLIPAVVALLRGVLSMPAGAALAVGIALQQGTRDGESLLWAAAIGAIGVLTIRGGEGAILDQLLGKNRTVRTDGN